MLTLLKEEKETARKYFLDNGIDFSETSGMLAAKDKNEILGYSLYTLNEKEMAVIKIVSDDLMLFDGILRSTLHIAAERGVMRALYADSLDKTSLEKLSFIKDEGEKTLDIDKLFKSCCGCE